MSELPYLDGFLIPVPLANRDAYLAAARAAAPIFREHGALAVVEAWGDDLPAGKVTDFHRAVAAEAGETVVFSWILWPSKAFRDEANPKVMADPRFVTADMPFDGKRMIFGGFQAIVDTAREA